MVKFSGMNSVRTDGAYSNQIAWALRLTSGAEVAMDLGSKYPETCAALANSIAGEMLTQLMDSALEFQVVVGKEDVRVNGTKVLFTTVRSSIIEDECDLEVAPYCHPETPRAYLDALELVQDELPETVCGVLRSVFEGTPVQVGLVVHGDLQFQVYLYRDDGPKTSTPAITPEEDAVLMGKTTETMEGKVNYDPDEYRDLGHGPEVHEPKYQHPFRSDEDKAPIITDQLGHAPFPVLLRLFNLHQDHPEWNMKEEVERLQAEYSFTQEELEMVGYFDTPKYDPPLSDDKQE